MFSYHATFFQPQSHLSNLVTTKATHHPWSCSAVLIGSAAVLTNTNIPNSCFARVHLTRDTRNRGNRILLHCSQREATKFETARSFRACYGSRTSCATIDMTTNTDTITRTCTLVYLDTPTVLQNQTSSVDMVSHISSKDLPALSHHVRTKYKFRRNQMTSRLRKRDRAGPEEDCVWYGPMRTATSLHPRIYTNTALLF